MILKKAILEQLSKKLSLPFTGVEQDWEIEMANSNRIDEFIKFYKENDLSEDMKMATMALILASYDDFLNDKNLTNDDRWNEIKLELNYRKTLFNGLIEYWSMQDEIEEVFKITPLIREIR